MLQFIINNMAPIMFAGLIVFLLFGFPVAFSLGACGLFFGFIGIELDEKHFETACRRIAAAYRQPRLFAEPAPKPQQVSLLEGAA